MFVDYGAVYYDGAKKTKRGRTGSYIAYTKPVALVGISRKVTKNFSIETALTWKLATAQIVYSF